MAVYRQHSLGWLEDTYQSITFEELDKYLDRLK
jgi:hypothetical protein